MRGAFGVLITLLLLAVSSDARAVYPTGRVLNVTAGNPAVKVDGKGCGAWLHSDANSANPTVPAYVCVATTAAGCNATTYTAMICKDTTVCKDLIWLPNLPRQIWVFSSSGTPPSLHVTVEGDCS